MKEGREHHVPLTKEALALIADRKGKLFPGYKDQMMELLSKLRPGYTVHGLRSSFTDWAAENDYPQELRELALAHAVGDSVERAYRHSTRLNKRREMMEAWANFVMGKSPNQPPPGRRSAPGALKHRRAARKRRLYGTQVQSKQSGPFKGSLPSPKRKKALRFPAGPREESCC
jgi:hypothetical protein